MKTLFLLLLALPLTIKAQDFNAHSSLVFLDSKLNDYKVVLSGESHWDKHNVERRKSMVEYLTTKNWLDVMILERDYSFGHWINEFLVTGDTVLLKELLKDDFFMSYNGIQYVDEYEFYTWLRKFLQKKDYKIYVVGIDMASYWEGEKLLMSFLRFTEKDSVLRNGLPASISKAKELLKQEKISIGAFKKWFVNMGKSLENLDYHNVHFTNYAFNIKQSKKWARGNPMKWRDVQIAKNFTKFIDSNENVYGQFGYGHVLLKKGPRMSGYNPFAAILNQATPYHGRILSIGLVSFNCSNSPECYSIRTGGNLYYPFLTKEEFELVKNGLIELPSNSYVEMKYLLPDVESYFQVLRVEHY